MSGNSELQSCAARMIISGSWDDHSDKAIKAAYGWNEYPDHMINHSAIAATKRYRNSGELREEIHKQLAEL